VNAGDGQPLPRRRSQRHQVIPAATADTDALSQVIADAFHDLPQSAWLIPDPGARRQILPGYFRLLIEEAMASGTVHTTDGRDGVALWLPPSAQGASQPDGYPARLAAVTGPWADRFTAFDATLDRNHPTGVVYHYLAILAVRSSRQGEGVGSSLLRAYHEILDREPDTLAYLEAATDQSRQLYRRHGYLPSGAFFLPGGGPAMYPMVRPPRSRSQQPAAAEPAPAAVPGVSVPPPRPSAEATS
jgi:GNAT superfamily N-acetyltransferase